MAIEERCVESEIQRSERGTAGRLLTHRIHVPVAIKTGRGDRHHSIEPDVVADIAAIVVSHNSASWLPDCLTSLRERAGDVDVDVVVVDSGSEDATADVVAAHDARLVRCANHGFAYANNRGFETTTAPWILFLNPDTRTV